MYECNVEYFLISHIIFKCLPIHVALYIILVELSTHFHILFLSECTMMCTFEANGKKLKVIELKLLLYNNQKKESNSPFYHDLHLALAHHNNDSAHCISFVVIFCIIFITLCPRFSIPFPFFLAFIQP